MNIKPANFLLHVALKGHGHNVYKLGRRWVKSTSTMNVAQLEYHTVAFKIDYTYTVPRPQASLSWERKWAKTEGSLVEFKSHAPLLLLHLSGRAHIKDRIKVRSGERSLMRAGPLKRSNGSGTRDLNSTRLPSVLARFSFPGEGSLGTRLEFIH